MGTNQDIFGMLELMLRPGFCVKNNTIEKINAAAQILPLHNGMDIRDLLATGQQEYAAFESGCLYLSLHLPPRDLGACVIRLDGWDIFVLDNQASDSALRALALAARTLRSSMSTAMVAATQLLSDAPKDSPQAALLNQGMYQLLRTLSNMSDAGRYVDASQQELVDIGSLFSEILEKAQTLLAASGIRLEYTPLAETVVALADREQLERALLNLLSNAVKFSDADTPVTVSLTRRGQMLYLRILNSGRIPQEVLGSAFSRYLRPAGLEDSQQGLGLGLVLVRAAAVNHGGTVLIDQPDSARVRITMSLAIRRSSGSCLHSPILRPDYAADRDHALLELSDCLHADAYRQN